jgi:chromosome segregation ATPase
VPPHKVHFRIFPWPAGGREAVVDPDAKKDVDEPGKPVVLTPKSYAYLKEESGKALIIEPHGKSDTATMAVQIADLEQTCRDAGAHIGRLEVTIERLVGERDEAGRAAAAAEERASSARAEAIKALAQVEQLRAELEQVKAKKPEKVDEKKGK